MHTQEMHPEMHTTWQRAEDSVKGMSSERPRDRERDSESERARERDPESEREWVEKLEVQADL